MQLSGAFLINSDGQEIVEISVKRVAGDITVDANVIESLYELLRKDLRRAAENVDTIITRNSDKSLQGWQDRVEEAELIKEAFDSGRFKLVIGN